MFLFSFFLLYFLFLAFFPSFFFVCPSTFKHCKDIKENLFQTLFLGRPATLSLGKPPTGNRSVEERGPAGGPERGLSPFFELARLPFPFGGCLLCELMTVIITSLSSFVISNPSLTKGGVDSLEKYVFIKHIAV